MNIAIIIKELVDRETHAWNTQDVELLLSLFQRDMVWPWPKTPKDHDPMNWVLVWGRYNYNRWKSGWQELFDAHDLIHNKREIKKIEITEQKDAAFAVVDIDTLWRSKEGKENHWKGRVCKVYTKLETGEWKMIMHTGVLDYDSI